MFSVSSGQKLILSKMAQNGMQFHWISILRASSSSSSGFGSFGIITLKMPFSQCAFTLSGYASGGRVNERLKLPYEHSIKIIFLALAFSFSTNPIHFPWYGCGCLPSWHLAIQLRWWFCHLHHEHRPMDAETMAEWELPLPRPSFPLPLFHLLAAAALPRDDLQHTKDASILHPQRIGSYDAGNIKHVDFLDHAVHHVDPFGHTDSDIEDCVVHFPKVRRPVLFSLFFWVFLLSKMKGSVVFALVLSLLLPLSLAIQAIPIPIQRDGTFSPSPFLTHTHTTLTQFTGLGNWRSRWWVFFSGMFFFNVQGMLWERLERVFSWKCLEIFSAQTLRKFMRR